jgi:tRNA-modifying protein YgfZ
MTDNWKTFLLQQGAEYQNGVVRHFGNPQSERRAMRAHNLLVDLSALSLIRVSGPDAKAFLNTQFTNDIDFVGPANSQLSAWCSAQGRMLAVFRIFARDGDYFLQLPTALQEEIVKRLRMFVLRSKVKIESADSELVRFGLVGPDAARLLGDEVSDVPESDEAVTTRDALSLLRLPGIQPRFEIIALAPAAIGLWEKLRSNAVPVGFAAWSWHDIMAGIPTVLPQTREEFVPQMANLELIRGVNFKKGCYPGQEIVARMQYLGRLKQRMYRAQVAADAVTPGTPIFAPGTGGQSVGTVVDAQPAPEQGTDLLAVIQIAAAAAGELRLGSDSGARLDIAPLPYPLATPQTQKAS